jgi:FtsH-binding integral membrane protein
VAPNPAESWTTPLPTAAARAEALDQGLRAYLLRIFNYMASGLALTGAVAWYGAQSGLYASIAATPLIWVVMLAPLGFVLVLQMGMERLSAFAAQALFWAFSAVMGLSLSAIFLVYTGQSVARTFFIAAGTFAAASLYGYTTRADLSRFSSLLMVGLFGIVLASLVNIFIGSSALQFAVSVIGVVLFTGLTAWDTQRLKDTYIEQDEAGETKSAIFGAVSLYLNFINLFTLLLNLIGAKREE